MVRLYAINPMIKFGNIAGYIYNTYIKIIVMIQGKFLFPRRIKQIFHSQRETEYIAHGYINYIKLVLELKAILKPQYNVIRVSITAVSDPY